MNILFTGGGTLGHIYSIVCVVRKLKEMGYNLFFIGTKAGLERDFVEGLKLFNKTFYLDSQGLRRSLSFKNINIIIKHFINIRKAKKILTDNKIDLVVGMGGYVSASVILAGVRLKIKTMIHEQNSIYGLANKIVLRKVDRILLTYPIEDAHNTVLVGNPRISEVYEKYKNDNYNIGKYILVVGGSRGANRINDLIISLKNQFLYANINVLLITGKKYYSENIEKISILNEEKFKIIDFTNDLPSLLVDAIVVVSRSGSCSIAEIMALKKVCLFIPSPNVTNNHQEKNALDIVTKGCCLMLIENELTKEKLFANIYRLYFDNQLRNRIINNINFNINVDSKSKFIKEIVGLLNRK